MARFIPVAEPVIGELEARYVADAVRSGWVSSLGPYIGKFEQGFASFVGAEHGVAVSNGTVGLHLAFHALGLGPGDEVLIPDLTFAATAHAVLQTGATPVLVDVEEDTWCMDPVAARRAVGPRTRAIVPVHLYGHPADMDAMSQLAHEFGLLVIEDAAEAHGATWRGSRVGNLGVAGVFSFYGNKIITTGEGGMITTNDGILAERLRYLKDHGMSPERRYYHTELAFNYRMTNIQAALGVAQLEQIQEFISRKREIAAWYNELLAGHDAIRRPVERPEVTSVYWMYSVVLDGRAADSRQEVGLGLRRLGVDWRPFFVPLHQLPHLSGLRAVGRDGPGCPVATRLGSDGLNLPSACSLDRTTVEYVADVLKRQIDVVLSKAKS